MTKRETNAFERRRERKRGAHSDIRSMRDDIITSTDVINRDNENIENKNYFINYLFTLLLIRSTNCE